MRRFGSSERRRSARAALCALIVGVACWVVTAPLVEMPAAVAVPAEARFDDAGGGTAEVEARVALGPGGRDIRLAGDLTEGVAVRVAALLAANPGVERIHLTSDGGLVDEAVELGRLVADRHLATYVPDVCASACTLVFVRGRARYLAAGGQLGFHAPYELGPGGRFVSVDPGAERAAYLAAGLAPDFVTRSLAVAPEEIWIPEPSHLLAAGVVTELVGSDRFPDSTLDADPSSEAARAAILRNLPILAALTPATIDAAVAWYRDGYLSGRTEADAIEGLRQRGQAALRHHIRVADDVTIRALGDAIRTEVPAAGAEACAALSRGDLVTVDEILKRARPGSPGLAPLLKRGTAETGIEAMAGRRRSRVAMAGRSLAPPGCAGPIVAIGRALDRAPHEAALALRAILSAEQPTAIVSAALSDPAHAAAGRR